MTPEPAQFLPTRYWGRWGPERGRDLPQAQQWAQGRAILRQSFFPWHVPSLSPSSPFGVPPRTDSEAALNRPSLGYQHLRFHAGNSEGDRAAVTDLLWRPLFWTGWGSFLACSLHSSWSRGLWHGIPGISQSALCLSSLTSICSSTYSCYCYVYTVFFCPWCFFPALVAWHTPALMFPL